MKNLVSIPNRCPADVSAMPQCEKGLYCAGCNKYVLDLRNKKLKEVDAILKGHETACIVVNERHTLRKAWPFAENIAAFLRRHRLKRIAAVLITSCLFLSSCYKRSRTVCGAMWKQPPGASEVISEK